MRCPTAVNLAWAVQRAQARAVKPSGDRVSWFAEALDCRRRCKTNQAVPYGASLINAAM
jgi:hypothetical protein